MLIINADDFGIDMKTTDNIVKCFRENRITSTSAMVFMQDSERAAKLSAENGLEVGLHLNFDDEFTGDVPGCLLREYQGRVGKFLRRNKYNQIIYNPFLRKQFDYLYRAQHDEFIRLYRRSPSHINGHHHMHLCSNVLLGNVIPDGSRVRRSFTFERGQRNIANLLYRGLVDRMVKRSFVTTDMFFAAIPSGNREILMKHLDLAKIHNVELMVHLSSQLQCEYVMRQEFIDLIRHVPRGTYRDIPPDSSSSDPVPTREFTSL